MVYNKFYTGFQLFPPCFTFSSVFYNRLPFHTIFQHFQTISNIFHCFPPLTNLFFYFFLCFLNIIYHFHFPPIFHRFKFFCNIFHRFETLLFALAKILQRSPPCLTNRKPPFHNISHHFCTHYTAFSTIFYSLPLFSSICDHFIVFQFFPPYSSM